MIIFVFFSYFPFAFPFLVYLISIFSGLFFQIIMGARRFHLVPCCCLLLAKPFYGRFRN